MGWTITASRKVEKSLSELPESVRLIMRALVAEMKIKGPYRANWSHYSPLRGSKNEFHCHLQSGRPTYVTCWRVDKKTKTVEIYYAGTHESAPY